MSFPSLTIATRPLRNIGAALANPRIRSGPQTTRFSCQARRRKAILNPREDENGNEMVVQITDRAAERLATIIEKEKKADAMLRVTVESGGCHGFQYLMALVDESKLDRKEDTIFQADQNAQARIVMDEPSLNLLKGSSVDFTSELIGSQFKIIDNPLATSSCGCGTSFDIKLD